MIFDISSFAVGAMCGAFVMGVAWSQSDRRRERQMPEVTRFYGGPMDGDVIHEGARQMVRESPSRNVLTVEGTRLVKGRPVRVSALYCNMLGDGNLYYIGPVESAEPWQP